MAVVVELRREKAAVSDQGLRVYLAARRGMIDAYRRERGRNDSSLLRRVHFISLDAPLAGDEEEFCGHDVLAMRLPDRYELDDLDLATLRAIDRLPEPIRETVREAARHKRGGKSAAARRFKVSEALMTQRFRRARQLIGRRLWARFRGERGDPRLLALRAS